MTPPHASQRPAARGPVRSTGRAPLRGPARASYRPVTQRLEVTFLPGLGEIVADEITERLAPARPPRPVPGREDALLVDHVGRLERALSLRTAVAVFLVLTFDVPRPKSLTSGEHLPRIAAAMATSVRLGAARTFRFEAAGHDSSVFQRLAAELAHATGLVHDDAEGEVVVRFRRTPRNAPQPGATRAPTDEAGWDVLVRLGGRPLSARPWRVADFPGAVNATIAAAIVRLVGTQADDRVANLMCGSGTLLIERLLAGPTATAVGVDIDPDAVRATEENVAAAGLADRATVTRADVTAAGGSWRDAGPFDLVLADPPWGALHGSHVTNPALHSDLLRVAHEVAAPGAHLVVLTHEIKVMERCIREADAYWRVRAELRVFAKGHHPRIYVLEHV
ncbi:class I SAM-dependent RNA methyltransferase [soil metagenome]